MSRLIDADALRETWVCQPGHDFEPSSFVYSIDNAPTVEPASPWRRVEEPPKKEGKYLVCWKDGGGFCYDTAWWTSVGTWSLSHWTGVTVTHWMPIEPPKEGTHENRDHP